MEKKSELRKSETTIINNGINNGLIAENIYVGNENIIIEENYSVIQINDPNFGANYVYNFKPKFGIWYEPFIAILFSEELTVSGTINLGPRRPYSETTEIDIITYNGKTDTFRILSLINSSSTPDFGFFLYSKNKPSFVIFGDKRSRFNIFKSSLN